MQRSLYVFLFLAFLSACVAPSSTTPVAAPSLTHTISFSSPTDTIIPLSPTVAVTPLPTTIATIVPHIEAENLEKLSIYYRTDAFTFNDTSTVFFAPQNNLFVFSHMPSENDLSGVTALSLEDFEANFSIPYLILRNAKIGQPPDGKRLVGSGYREDTKTQHLRVFNLETNTLEFESDTNWKWDLSVSRWSPNNLWFATGALDGVVTVHSSKNYQTLFQHKLQQNRIAAIDFSPDSQWMAVGGSESAVYIWNTANWDEPALRIPVQASILSLRFSPDGSLLAIATSKQFLFFETPTWESVSPIGLKEYFSALEFSPDGKLLAAGTSEGRILFWRTDTWEKVTELAEHKTRIVALSFSPDGQYFASISISTFNALEKDPSKQGKKSELIVWRLASP